MGIIWYKGLYKLRMVVQYKPQMSLPPQRLNREKKWFLI